MSLIRLLRSLTLPARGFVLVPLLALGFATLCAQEVSFNNPLFRGSLSVEKDPVKGYYTTLGLLVARDAAEGFHYEWAVTIVDGHPNARGSDYYVRDEGHTPSIWSRGGWEPSNPTLPLSDTVRLVVNKFSSIGGGETALIAPVRFYMPNRPLNQPHAVALRRQNGAGPWTIVKTASMPGWGWNPTDQFKLNIIPNADDPTVSLTASARMVTIGASVDLTMGHSNAAPTGRTLTGPTGLLASEPDIGRSFPVMPALRDNVYRYTVKGFVQLSWNSEEPLGTFRLTGPDGFDAEDVDLFDIRSVTIPGHYTLTQTYLGIIATAEIDVSPESKFAEVTVTAVNPSDVGTPTSSIAPTSTVPLTIVTTSVPPTTSVRVTTSLPLTTSIPLGTPFVQAFLNPMESSHSVGGGEGVRVYKRLWQESERWHAYLGRSGLRFEISGASPAGLAAWELEAREPKGSTWKRVAEGTVSGSLGRGRKPVALAVSSLQLGEVSADDPLVPASFAAGHALTGEWHLRARVQSRSGTWSAWTPEQAVQVVLPIVQTVETLRTCPPAGPEGEWFEASPKKEFPLTLWVP